MFEKEAEEYAKQNNPAEYGVKATHFTVLNSFKDGAEFGYNKATDEWHENDAHVEVGRGNGKSQMCFEALVKQEIIKSASTETLLKELKDRGVIRSWYYNGEYHVGNELPQSARVNFNRTKF